MVFLHLLEAKSCVRSPLFSRMVKTEKISEYALKTLHAIIRGKVAPNSVITSDRLRDNKCLVDMEHYHLYYGANKLAEAIMRIHEIEYFHYVKSRLHKFQGIPKKTVPRKNYDLKFIIVNSIYIEFFSKISYRSH